MVKRATIVAGVVLVATGFGQAQGGLEVRVLSARVIPNPQPERAPGYHEPRVLQLEVVGTDRSGASALESRAEDIALFNATGQAAAHFLYDIPGPISYSYDEGKRAEISSRLIFSVPADPNQQYLLRWTVSRYQKDLTSFTWMKEDQPLQLPLTEERRGITVTVEKLAIGHLSQAELAEWGSLDAPAQARMAADHLIVTLSVSGLLADLSRPLSLESLSLSTAEPAEPGRDNQLYLDASRMKYDMASVDPNPVEGSLRRATANATAHFYGVSKLPQLKKLTLDISRPVPFDEGWAALAIGQ